MVLRIGGYSARAWYYYYATWGTGSAQAAARLLWSVRYLATVCCYQRLYGAPVCCYQRLYGAPVCCSQRRWRGGAVQGDGAHAVEQASPRRPWASREPGSILDQIAKADGKCICDLISILCQISILYQIAKAFAIRLDAPASAVDAPTSKHHTVLLPKIKYKKPQSQFNWHQ
eukprot:2844780-Rhodomonas_salina.2